MGSSEVETVLEHNVVAKPPKILKVAMRRPCMARVATVFVVLLGLVLLSGCNHDDKLIGSTSEGKIFLDVYGTLKRGDQDCLNLKPKNTWTVSKAFDEKKLKALCDYAESFLIANHLEFLSFTEFHSTVSATDGRTSQLKGRFKFTDVPSKGIQVTVDFKGPSENLMIMGIKFAPISGNADLSESFDTFNYSNFRGLGSLQLVALVTSALSTILCATAFALCLLTSHLRRKIIWSFVTLIGLFPTSVGPLGELAFNPISFTFLGGKIAGWGVILGITIDPYLPPLPPGVVFSIPAGALIFLLKRRTLTTPAKMLC